MDFLLICLWQVRLAVGLGLVTSAHRLAFCAGLAEACDGAGATRLLFKDSDDAVCREQILEKGEDRVSVDTCLDSPSVNVARVDVDDTDAPEAQECSAALGVGVRSTAEVEPDVH